MFGRILFVNKGISNAAIARCFKTSSILPATSNTPVAFDPSKVAEYKQEIEALLKQELPKPYDGPERDHVNFPRPTRGELPGKVRMGFLPDEWFTFFYKKTGVTGPYVFGTGLITFLLSKEWYVIEEEFSTGCALFFLIYMAVKKLGPATRKYLEAQQQKDLDMLNKPKVTEMKELNEAIEEAKKQVWYAEGNKLLMHAKRENIAMQLEAEYRKRMMNVYEETKKRLDYHLEFYNTKRKLEQKHMVDWVVNNVVKSITPQQEKEALQKCIEDLKVLSLK
ncbi:hypothetical protein JTE90_009207 [Oedothorax gibbosus]|uniref:ATP synthase subunit b n=1 Tax=Oedothorax gibbosus TaxID=931172 RepID=A0AAV6UWG7_9ARAC|nr:hypothetical protein JTE90_009207 [Oedothorax gibbosus]